MNYSLVIHRHNINRLAMSHAHVLYEDWQVEVDSSDIPTRTLPHRYWRLMARLNGVGDEARGVGFSPSHPWVSDPPEGH